MDFGDQGEQRVGVRYLPLSSYILLRRKVQLIEILRNMSAFPPPPISTMDWKNLDQFGLQEVNGHIESTYHKDTGRWTPLKFVSDPYLRIHGLAPGLNYGQQAFEGLKAFRMPGDPGGISIFRPDRNAGRLQHSSGVLNMPAVPADMFVRACQAAVALNAGYVPPHESGGALYCRPLLFASGPTFIPGVPNECTFCVYVLPTLAGAQEGAQAVKALILDDFDRAAPKGTGHAKAGGNYPGVLRWTGQAKTDGFGITLHLDSARHEEVDEFSLCGFLGVKLSSPGPGSNDGDDEVTIVVPDSPSAIESLTSDSVQHIARSWGWRVEKRPVPYWELPEFSEVFGAGTGVGLIPVRSITRRGRTGRLLPPSPRLLTDSDDSETVVYIRDEQQGGGPLFEKLLAQLRAIQFGRIQDEFGWRLEVRAEDQELDG
ncbi:Uncharacterized protein TPAR_08713 [Tolypocladium paradoxum]|uniref:Branched-chain-amino-acid aminotransferase TOXF n=1 Tax=Tolypocladium paradoxum TaxID=94208 RepID=A0A2S4KLR1_9HYPO|nr:Uncharacterized protein TPAR_08713 [Tolypocladium paradoxum]